MKIIVQNIATEYEDSGQGTVVLMLHGWKDSLNTFDGLVLRLAGYRVIRVDMPGFGNSEEAKEAWGVGEYVEFVRAFIEKIGITPEVIIGHSFGGRVSIKGVGSGVLKPKQLVLIASAGLARRRTLKNHLFAGVAKIGRALTSIPPLSFWQNTIRRALYDALGSDYFRAGSLKDTFVKVVSEDLSAYAAKISIPTLLIWGRQDASTPLMQGEKIHDIIEDSQLDLVNGAGHFVHREQPEKVAEFINDFLKRKTS